MAQFRRQELAHELNLGAIRLIEFAPRSQKPAEPVLRAAGKESLLFMVYSQALGGIGCL